MAMRGAPLPCEPRVAVVASGILAMISNGRPSRQLSKLITSGWWFGTFFIFPYIGNVIIPTDELIFFRVAQPPTRLG